MVFTEKGIGAARQFTEQMLGGPIAESENQVSVTTSYTTLCKINGDRVGLVIINLGTVDVFIAISVGVGSTNAIRLGANGGGVAMSVVEDFTLPAREWGAVVVSGTTANVYVLEVVRFTTT
jgi:hypothetical protein